MLSRAELRRIYTSHTRTPLGIVALTLAVIGFVGFFGWVIRVDLVGPIDNQLFGCGPLLCTYLSVPLGIVWLARSLRQVERDDRLRCPHCHAAFAMRLPRWTRWVLRTGRCCECGLAVASDALPSEPYTRTEFQAAQTRIVKQIPYVIGCLTLHGMMGVVFIAWWLYGMANTPGNILRPLRDPVLFVFPPMLLLAVIRWRLFPDQPLLNCPHCGSRLDIPHALRTNACRRCRRQVLTDDPLGVEPPPPGG